MNGRQKFVRILVCVCLLSAAAPLSAATYHVSVAGNDTHPGTQAKPFRTIQKAADSMKAGDTCLIRAGTYHEAIVLKNSGEAGKPIRFMAQPGQMVLLDGTAPVVGQWTQHEGKIYKIKVDAPIEQLFLGREMMVEARWPNMEFNTQLFSREAWAATVEGSRYGVVKDPELAKTNVDWTGAHITLNVAHQFFTWTRTVTRHGMGQNTLTYPKDLRGITHYADGTKGWNDDYYWLSGKLEALDVATEWFYDAREKLLYFYPPDGQDPNTLPIRYRTRQYAVTGKRLHDVQLSGLRFFSCSFDFEQCENLVVDGCRLLFPTYSRHVRSPEDGKYRTGLSGTHNTIRNCIIAYASHTGLSVTGDSNLIENCLIRDVCWHGCLGHPGLLVYGNGSVSRRNTIYNGGNALLQCPGGDQTVAYNHVYNGGLLCRDVALVYTQLPRCRGTVIHHNWVHGCMTEGFAGHDRLGGMGIRGDDQTRGLIVHHNVVWDCGIHGIIVKGDDNLVFNNTVFDVGPRELSRRNDTTSKHLLIPTRAEPKKPWRDQHPLLDVQNANSIYCNNALGNIVWRSKPLPPSDRIGHNLEFRGKPASSWLADPRNMDFRPPEGSPLIDAGRLIGDYTGGFLGKAPDIGAYEYGGTPWKAGADLPPEIILPNLTR